MSHAVRKDGHVSSAAEGPRSLTVTRPSLPPLEALLPHLEAMWETRVLSNFGPYHRRFEAALAEHLGVEHLSLVANATLGLLLGIRQLGLTGEVITTPFSFVATAHALAFHGITPVFADIDEKTLNLDPEAIERSVTERTTGILAVHCFGRPCNVDAIDAIARRHGLKVLYDAAHAFGVRHEGASVLSRGDLSVLSFHATKVFQTIEGGAVICPDAKTKQSIDRATNFGIVDETTVESIGINAKMNELSAAIGLLQLARVDDYVAARRRRDEMYRFLFRDVEGIRCVERVDEGSNYYAFPILVEPTYPLDRDALHRKLREHGIHTRRYFHPLLSTLPMYRDLPSAGEENLLVAASVASRILCLPLFPDLRPEEQAEIVQLIRG